MSTVSTSITAQEFSTEKFLKKPLELLNILVGKQSITELKRSSDWGFTPALTHTFKLNEAKSDISLIPSLNSTTAELIGNGGLCRFRCMVQDSLEQEFFVGVYEEFNPTTDTRTIKSGKYADLFEVSEGCEVDFDAPSSVKFDRIPLLCVNVPGENAWAKSTLDNSTTVSHNNNSSSGTKKRSRGEDESKNDDSMSDINENEPENENKIANNDSSMTDALEMKSSEASEVSSKRMKESSQMDIHNGVHTKLPTRFECIVTVYDNNSNAFKVGDCVEFIGVLSIEPELANATEEESHREMERSHAHAVRLHAITGKKFNQSHGLTTEFGTSAFSERIQQLTPDVLARVRGSLVQYLTGVCGGDSLAAELLLLHMMSRVHSRAHGRALGKFSLAINTGVEDSNLPTTLTHLFAQLMPKSLSFSMSIQELCKQRMAPVKDYDANELCGGILQSAPGTFLLLDETKLSEGQLDNTGCVNLRAIHKLITSQQLEYDFHYNTMDFDVDLPILTVTAAKKSLLGAQAFDLSYPLRSSVSSTLPTVSADIVNGWRQYLLLARQLPFELSDEAAKGAEEYFVSLRKALPHSNESTLHFVLTLARLLSVSHMESSLTAERFAQTQTLAESVFHATQSMHNTAF